MRYYISILFLLIGSALFATNYYVKNGGSDVLSGIDDANAWETIAKVNATSFSADDTIFFNKGNTFIGTLTPATSGTSGHNIVFSAYGTGDNPIITPNAEIIGITWSAYGSDGIYSTTDIPYNPGSLLIDLEDKVYKINDYFFTNVNTTFFGLTSLGLMALATNYQYNTGANGNVYFWDGWEALYCYDTSTGTTYFRFRGGEDPNDSTFMASITGTTVAGGSAVYINGKSYITVRNLTITGGETGVNLINSASNCIIEYNTVTSSNRKIYTHLGAKGNTIRYNTITENRLSSYSPKAYLEDGGIHYERTVARHIYEFAKYGVDRSDSPNVDCGIYVTPQIGGSTNDGTIVNNNTITYCANGIYIGGLGVKVYSNEIYGTSSIGIYFGETSKNSEAYSNYLYDTNYPFRFNYVDNATYTDRVNYIYKNRIYTPTAGHAIYIHTLNTQASTMYAYFYHNSFICKTGIALTNKYALLPEATPTNFIFIDNIFSVSGNNTYGSSSWAKMENLFTFYHNWMGGYFIGASALPGQISEWATDVSNLNHVGSTFWIHSTNPPTFAIEGTEALDAGIDISEAFTLGGVNYSALPGFESDYWSGSAPDLGYYEYETGEPPVVPTLSTDIPSSISISQALSGGTVIYDGERDVTDRGLCWSTSADPEITDNTVSSGSGLGSFTGTITGLSSSTTYHVRAFATNSIGTGYGIDREFTTPDYGVGWHEGKVVFHNGKIVIVK